MPTLARVQREQRICSIEGCGRAVDTKGWCGAHYMRWRRHGDPEIGRPFRHQDRMAWFWQRVVGGVGCWSWLGGHDTQGYSRVRWEGKNQGAHRVAFLLAGGVIPEGTEADHLCRNRGCVRPDHLEFVFHRVNVQRGATGQVNGLRQSKKTHCALGHAYDEENTHWVRTGRGSGWGRQCRACGRLRRKEYYRRQKGHHANAC